MAGLDAAKARRDKLEHDFYVEGTLSEDRFKTLAAEQSAAIEALDIEAGELARRQISRSSSRTARHSRTRGRSRRSRIDACFWDAS